MAQKNTALEELKAKRESEDRARALKAIGNVLTTEDGKTALWTFVRMSSFFAPNLYVASSDIYKNMALRDLGRDMMTLLVNANEQAVFDLQRAEWHRAAQERIEDEKILKEKD